MTIIDRNYTTPDLPSTGPLAGGPWDPHDPTPRSVTRAYFEQICPQPKLLSGDIVQKVTPTDFSALTLLALWTRAIKDIPENCLVIDTRIFNLEYANQFSPASIPSTDLFPPVAPSAPGVRLT